MESNIGSFTREELLRLLREQLFLSKLGDKFALPVPLMLIGKHGVGKTQILEAFAEDNGLKVINIRASLYSEGDFAGIPEVFERKGKKSMRFIKMDRLMDAIHEPSLLFFDELDRATPEVRQGIFEMSGSRKFSGMGFHPQTLVVSAINGDLHEDYDTRFLDKAESSRWHLLRFAPTISEWIEWAEERLEPEIPAFISENNRFLENEDTESEASLTITPDRRKWGRANAYVKAFKLKGLSYTDDNLEGLERMLGGLVSANAARAFIPFFKSYKAVLLTKENFFATTDVDGFVNALIQESLPTQVVFLDNLVLDEKVKEVDNVERMKKLFLALKNEVSLSLVNIVDLSDKAVFFKYLRVNGFQESQAKEVSENPLFQKVFSLMTAISRQTTLANRSQLQQALKTFFIEEDIDEVKLKLPSSLKESFIADLVRLEVFSLLGNLKTKSGRKTALMNCIFDMFGITTTEFALVADKMLN